MQPRDLLDLLPRQHVTEAYRLERLWGTDRAAAGLPWYSWRCTCGRDPGAEHRAAFSHEATAEEMAGYHRRDREPWLHAGASR